MDSFYQFYQKMLKEDIPNPNPSFNNPNNTNMPPRTQPPAPGTPPTPGAASGQPPAPGQPPTPGAGQPPVPGQPAKAPVQGGQTSPAVPPNPMTDPKTQQAIQTLQGIKDPRFQQAFQQFQKVAGIQSQGSPQQSGGMTQQ